MQKLIVGIGNPGSKYAATRHNAGAWFIDEIVNHYHLQLNFEKKFQLELAELNFENERVIIAKTTCFMNLSGQSIAAYAKFFQIKPQEIIVAHDELDLNPGSTRLKIGGGHGGHNGLRDILAHLGFPDFYRLRIGIGHPGNKDLVESYVLHAPSLDDKIEISRAIDKAVKLFPDMLRQNFAKVMNELHQ